MKLCLLGALKFSFSARRKSIVCKKVATVGEEDEEVSRAPHSFVVHRGKTGKFVQELSRDFRKVRNIEYWNGPTEIPLHMKASILYLEFSIISLR